MLFKQLLITYKKQTIEKTDSSVNIKAKICLQNPDGFIILNLDEILFIQSDDVYANVQTLTERHFISSSLKSIQAITSGGFFFRCHRSYIVNLDKVKQIVKRPNCTLIMENGDEVPVARKWREEVVSRLRSETYY